MVIQKVALGISVLHLSSILSALAFYDLTRLPAFLPPLIFPSAFWVACSSLLGSNLSNLRKGKDHGV